MKNKKNISSFSALKRILNTIYPWEIIHITSQEYSDSKHLIINQIKKKFNQEEKRYKVVKFEVIDKQGDKSLPRYIFELLKAIPSTNAVILSSSFWLHPRGCHLAQRWKRRPFILEVTKNMRKDKKIKFIDQIKLYKNFFLYVTEN